MMLRDAGDHEKKSHREILSANSYGYVDVGSVGEELDKQLSRLWIGAGMSFVEWIKLRWKGIRSCNPKGYGIHGHNGWEAAFHRGCRSMASNPKETSKTLCDKSEPKVLKSLPSSGGEFLTFLWWQTTTWSSTMWKEYFRNCTTLFSKI